MRLPARMRPRATGPAGEWRDAFRRSRNAFVAWLLIAGAGSFAVSKVGIDHELGALPFMTVFFGVAGLAYNTWRLSRLLLTRRELSDRPRPLGRVFVAIVGNPLPRTLHELVLVWLEEPSSQGERLNPPDLRYLADLSEDMDADVSDPVVVREAWTLVDDRGRPRGGRWFQTADNLVMTIRRAGPLVRLVTRRGPRWDAAIVRTAVPAPVDIAATREPIGFRGLLWAVLWRAVGVLSIGWLAVVTE